MQGKTKACEDATQNLTEVKTLHAKQCQELQLQVELLQEGSSEKTRQFEEEKRKLQEELDDRLRQVAELERMIQEKQQVLVIAYGKLHGAICSDYRLITAYLLLR